MFNKHDEEHIQIGGMYIDDLIVIGSKPSKVKTFKEMKKRILVFLDEWP